MSQNSRSRNHLPLFYNPFLNCLFNNPYYNKGPLYRTIQQLANDHNDFMLIVPPADMLNECSLSDNKNSSKRTRLVDLCYLDEEFVQSHVIRMQAIQQPSSISGGLRNHLLVFSSLNQKEVVVRNGYVMTRKGFKQGIKAKVLNIDYFYSFCDYFPRGSCFALIYVDKTLYGSHGAPYSYIGTNGEDNTILTKRETMDSIEKENVPLTFEMLLRSLPLFSKAVSNKLFFLFHHSEQYKRITGSRPKSLSNLKANFYEILEKTFAIVQECISEQSKEGEQVRYSLRMFLSSYSEADLNKLIHEYVEMNLYDTLWTHLVFLFSSLEANNKDEQTKQLTKDRYNKLACVSLNHLDVPIKDPWYINELHKRICKAISEFVQLADLSITDLARKLQILVNAVNILTDGGDQSRKNKKEDTEEGLIVSADLLIGLLIMVVIHSRIEHLEAHLYYVRNFNSLDITANGYLSYILSNFDAVIHHLFMKGSNQYNDLELYSDAVSKLWHFAERGDLNELSTMLGETKRLYSGKDLPDNHFLKSKTVEGEGILIKAARSRSLSIFNMVLNYENNWFTLEDVLFEKNVVNDQNLATISLIEGSYEILEIVIDIILANTSFYEQYAYFNSVDHLGKSIGHYSFYDYRILNRIGRIIDWEQKDRNSQTPLFSVCRSYDNPCYAKLIQESFQCVYDNSRDGYIDLDKHTDKHGNSLLHILPKCLKETQILTREKNLLNLNQLNAKGMTPLMQYVKFSRLENIKDILADIRLDFKFDRTSYFFNVFDYLCASFSKDYQNNVRDQITKILFFHFLNNFFPGSCDLKQVILNIRYSFARKEYEAILLQPEMKECIFLPLEKVVQFSHMIKIINPNSFIPDCSSLWVNYPLVSPPNPIFSNILLNQLADRVNLYLITLFLHPDIDVATNSIFDLMKEKLMLDFTYEKLKKIERGKEKANVNLDIQRASEMEAFFKFSFGDLLQFQTVILKIKKLVAVMGYKQSDFRYVTDKFLHELDQFAKADGHSNFCAPILGGQRKEHRGVDASYIELMRFMSWLESCVSELNKSIRKALSKVATWRQSYATIKQLSNELKRLDVKELISFRETSEGFSNAVDKDPHSSTSENLKLLKELDSHSRDFRSGLFSNGFFTLSSVLENKSHRFEKLVVMKSDELRKFIRISIDLKLEHEAIASEISSFLNYKSNFIAFALHRFTKVSLCSLKNRIDELYLCLSRL